MSSPKDMELRPVLQPRGRRFRVWLRTWGPPALKSLAIVAFILLTHVAFNEVCA